MEKFLSPPFKSRFFFIFSAFRRSISFIHISLRLFETKMLFGKVMRNLFQKFAIEWCSQAKGKLK